MQKAETEHNNLLGAVESAAYGTAEFINSTKYSNRTITKSDIDAYAYKLLELNQSSRQTTATLVPASFSLALNTDNIVVNACSNLKPNIKLPSTQKICASITAKLLVVDPPMTITMISSKLNNQTGLVEVLTRVTNPSYNATGPISIAVNEAALPVSGSYLWGRNRSGSPQIIYLPGLQSLETKDFILELYVPTRQLPATVGLTVAKTAISSMTAPTTTGNAIIPFRVISSTMGYTGVVIEFNSVGRKYYLVQYSDDNINWKTAYTPQTQMGAASNTTTQWFDNGPPKTDSKPLNATSRHYRAYQIYTTGTIDATRPYYNTYTSPY